MRIATWNVNGLKARREELMRWLQETQPDVMGLQEIRAGNAKFLNRFRDELKEADYHAEFHEEPRYRGVAILSRHPLNVTRKGLPRTKGAWAPGSWPHPQPGGRSPLCACPTREERVGRSSRGSIHSASTFVSGTTPRRRPWSAETSTSPRSRCDNWSLRTKRATCTRERIGYRTEEQSRIRSLRDAGWFDLVREANPGDRSFSYWNSADLYRQNKGLRIGLVFGNRVAFERLQSSAHRPQSS